jgi:hypothetical protein
VNEQKTQKTKHFIEEGDAAKCFVRSIRTRFDTDQVKVLRGQVGVDFL